jgi:E3 ubiquitin-protein ligase BRE1
MQEYKREKITLEAKVKEMAKAATFYNDHLRIIDVWFKQVSTLCNVGHNVD